VVRVRCVVLAVLWVRIKSLGVLSGTKCARITQVASRVEGEGAWLKKRRRKRREKEGRGEGRGRGKGEGRGEEKRGGERRRKFPGTSMPTGQTLWDWGHKDLYLDFAFSSFLRHSFII
jgi:hypothetical protein